MRIRAVIFDVYATLLRVGPPPPDADDQWRTLFQDCFQAPPPLGRFEFSVACNQVIAARHKAAHARGIAFPEILWPQVVAEVLPAFRHLPATEQEEFIYRQMQLGRTLSLQGWRRRSICCTNKGAHWDCVEFRRTHCANLSARAPCRPGHGPVPVR